MIEMFYRAGLYTRLSKESTATKHSSDSIDNQIILLSDFCKKNNIVVIDTYIDDGFSGTTFDRPAFMRLLQDIENGRINTVLTKDLSRLGRNYVEVGKFLERSFPTKNIRYIAVNDQIDTAKEYAKSDLVPFQNLFNELYAKDISEKVRVTLNFYRIKGLFIGSYAPYGYLKYNKNYLKHNPTEMIFVKRIFEMFLSGMSCQNIADSLNLAGIPTPGETKKHYRASNVWNRLIVRRILLKRTYIGDLEQGLVQKMNYKSKKQIWIPKEKHIIANQTHQAVICKKDWDLVQHILQAGERGKMKDRLNPSHINITGLLVCYDCGGSISCWSTMKKPYYICSSWKKDTSHCTSHGIKMKALQYTLCQLTDVFIRSNVTLTETICHIVKTVNTSTLKKLWDWENDEYKRYAEILVHLVIDRELGHINTEDYDILKKWFSERAAGLSSYITCLKKSIQLKEDGDALKKYLYTLICDKSYDRMLFFTLYRRIQILQGNRLKIFCKFNFK